MNKIHTIDLGHTTIDISEEKSIIDIQISFHDKKYRKINLLASDDFNFGHEKELKDIKRWYKKDDTYYAS